MSGRQTRAGAGLVLAAVLVAGGGLLPRRAVALGNIYTVTSTADTTATGTLRWAINQANASTGFDTIQFNISPSGGVKTINLGSELPAISSPVEIRGDTQPGYSTSPVIELNGSGAGGNKNGLIINSGGNGTTIRALTINRFKGDGILMSTASNCVIAGCYIGTNNTGASASGNNKNGIELSGGTNNRIGGTPTSDHNLISGNSGDGVLLDGVSNSSVIGNTIGTNLAGNAAVGNGDDGVEVTGGTGNTVGGANLPIGASSEAAGSSGIGNLISGNGLNGIYLNGATSGNIVYGNTIGSNLAGNAEVHNGRDGIAVGDAQLGSANNNTIGGSAAGQPNFIAYNQQHGVHLDVGSGNVLMGNLVYANSQDAVQIGSASNNTIGGINDGEGNVIQNSGQFGIHATDGGTGNSFLRNLI